MRHITYTPNGVCSKQINFDIDDAGNIHNLQFTGGCSGNLRAISKLLEGQNAVNAANILQGNMCGARSTSCADQLAQAIIQAGLTK